MKLSRQEKKFLLNLHKQTPETYVESKAYALDSKKIVDITEGEIKNRALTDTLITESKIDITSGDGVIEKKEWMRGTIFIKVNVWRKIKQAYIDGYKKATKGIPSSSKKYSEEGIKGGLDAAIAYHEWVNKNNMRLNQKYAAEVPVAVSQDKKSLVDKIKGVFKK